MASLQLYIQKMFADMQTAMASLVTAMSNMLTSLTTLSGKADSQITELQAVAAAVIAGTPSLNVKVGTDENIAITIPGGLQPDTVGDYRQICSFSSHASGIVNFTCELKAESTSRPPNLYFSINGGTKVLFSALTSCPTSFTEHSFNLPVVPGTITLFLEASVNTYYVSINTAASIKYSLMDIVTEGVISAA